MMRKFSQSQKKLNCNLTKKKAWKIKKFNMFQFSDRSWWLYKAVGLISWYIDHLIIWLTLLHLMNIP